LVLCDYFVLLRGITLTNCSTKDPGEGTGLGLAICYMIIKEHGGTIHVENEKDGVSFVIEIPFKA